MLSVEEQLLPVDNVDQIDVQHANTRTSSRTHARAHPDDKTSESASSTIRVVGQVIILSALTHARASE